ncbi:alanine dehydrogenase [Corynebacterium cystitidis]|uniref:Alanine dehydrogenase n=1 Tax=Corynebacterium cystitidis DSM 20524 TaxID=1121357 RepID=A0A1H9QKR2_9CORY|nr:alanine dehydrogenase [Corynebacterium cystitidis]WJY81747.1 Alanine dehydrogenase 2 [Corynebacterium cystitidis DSM 20524]SER60775.1 alanine dehydrogenase [Corynebacterium cystitidis DSM 20524]SNV84079.1 alanine dehydrogenase [Corynebacterium cystitidis]
MIIGTVRELKSNESRVGLTPDAVRCYVDDGHTVLVESGAGKNSLFPDTDYEAMGAQIVDNAAEVWQRCEMMVKVKEPVREEFQYFREDLILFTYLHLAANAELTQALIDANVTAIAYETVVGPSGKDLPLLAPMSYVAGRLSIQEGANCLKATNGGAGKLLGGVPGTEASEIVIIGGGAVGTQAAQMAVGTDARVTILESNPERILELSSMFQTSLQVIQSTPATIETWLQRADLVISCVLIPGAKAPQLIRREHLPLMKKGSVIVDVAIDQGGSTEMSRPTTHDQPTFIEDGVVMYCVANMPGAVPQTSTIALNNATMAYGLAIAQLGLHGATEKFPGLKHGVNVYRGAVTHQGVADATGHECIELQL